jgi:hypothetical protein
MSGKVDGFAYLGQAKADPQWGQYRVADPMPNGHHANGQERRQTWKEESDGYRKNLTPTLRAELAAAFGLPESALGRLDVGFSPNDYSGPCWTFPEVDAGGAIVGILRRFRVGEKKALKDSKRGLIVPRGWKEASGPLLLVEGPSDVAAAVAMGLAAVGRPSNVGGIDHLAALLKDWPADREIIVVGEFDPNDKGQWPGRDGAIKTATELSRKLGRAIAWTMPPDKAKDLRAWVNSKKPDCSCQDEWQDLGQALEETLRKNAVKVGGEQAALDSGYRFNPIDSPTFASKNLFPKWLVKRILVEGLAAVVGGPRKSLKTTIVCDLIISAASVTPFLGTFEVPCAVPSAFISGESGDFTIQETAKRICRAKGIDLACLPIWWDFRLPQFADASHLASLRDGLKERGIKLCGIDPIYLSLMGGSAAARLDSADIFDMGPLLLDAGRACLDAGATPILAHHTKKGTAKSLEPLELEDLSGAGVAEFARTWMLLSRFAPYEPGTGVHKLWMSVGGSIGFGSLSALEIEEGPIADDFTGRKWQVTVLAAGIARAQKQDEKEEEKTTKTERAHKKEEGKVLNALDALVERMKKQERKYPSMREVRTAAALSDENMKRTVFRLTEASVVEVIPVTIKTGRGRKVEREVDGLKRKTRTDGTDGTDGIFHSVQSQSVSDGTEGPYKGPLSFTHSLSDTAKKGKEVVPSVEAVADSVGPTAPDARATDKQTIAHPP